MCEPARSLEFVACGRQRGHLSRRRDFRQRDDEPFGQPSARSLEQPGQEEIECSHAASLELFAQRFDPDPDARRKRVCREASGHVFGRLGREMILFLVRPGAKTVFEVDPEILDRFPLQFVDDARTDASGQRRRYLEGARERGVARREFVERSERCSSKLLSDI